MEKRVGLVFLILLFSLMIVGSANAVTCGSSIILNDGTVATLGNSICTGCSNCRSSTSTIRDSEANTISCTYFYCDDSSSEQSAQESTVTSCSSDADCNPLSMDKICRDGFCRTQCDASNCRGAGKVCFLNQCLTIECDSNEDCDSGEGCSNNVCTYGGSSGHNIPYEILYNCQLFETWNPFIKKCLSKISVSIEPVVANKYYMVELACQHNGQGDSITFDTTIVSSGNYYSSLDAKYCDLSINPKSIKVNIREKYSTGSSPPLNQSYLISRADTKLSVRPTEFSLYFKLNKLDIQCTGNNNCGDGLVCVFASTDSQSNNKICALPCQDDTDCSVGKVCSQDGQNKGCITSPYTLCQTGAVRCNAAQTCGSEGCMSKQCRTDSDCGDKAFCNTDSICKLIPACTNDLNKKAYFEYNNQKTGTDLFNVSENNNVNIVIPFLSNSRKCFVNPTINIYDDYSTTENSWFSITKIASFYQNPEYGEVLQGTASGTNYNFLYKQEWNTGDRNIESRDSQMKGVNSKVSASGTDNKAEYFFVATLASDANVKIKSYDINNLPKSLLHVIPKEVCNDNIDNDLNGKVDCYDSNCGLSKDCNPIVDLRFDKSNYQDYNELDYYAQKRMPKIDGKVNLSDGESMGFTKSIGDQLLASEAGYTIGTTFTFNPDPTRIRGNTLSPPLYPVFAMYNLETGGELLIGINSSSILVYNNGKLRMTYVHTNPRLTFDKQLISLTLIANKLESKLKLYMGTTEVAVGDYEPQSTGVYYPSIGSVRSNAGYQTIPATFDNFVIYDYVRPSGSNNGDHQIDINADGLEMPLTYLNFTKDLTDYKGRAVAGFFYSPSLQFANSKDGHGKAATFVNDKIRNITRPGYLDLMYTPLQQNSYNTNFNLENIMSKLEAYLNEIYTIETWVNFDRNLAYNSSLYLTNNKGISMYPILSNDYYILGMNESCISYICRPGAGGCPENKESTYCKSSSENPLTGWHHIAFVINETDISNQKIKLYLDGQQKGISQGNLKSNHPLFNTFIALGGFYNPNGGKYNAGFGGLIDDFKLWGYGRTPAQINDDLNNYQCTDITNPCPNTHECQNHECVLIDLCASVTCSENQQCNPNNGQCESNGEEPQDGTCLTDAQCLATQKCSNNQCVAKECQTDANCNVGEICDLNSWDCTARTCTDDDECGTDAVCNEGNCEAETCITNDECTGSNICSGGHCSVPGLGQGGDLIDGNGLDCENDIDGIVCPSGQSECGSGNRNGNSYTLSYLDRDADTSVMQADCCLVECDSDTDCGDDGVCVGSVGHCSKTDIPLTCDTTNYNPTLGIATTTTRAKCLDDDGDGEGEMVVTVKAVTGTTSPNVIMDSTKCAQLGIPFQDGPARCETTEPCTTMPRDENGETIPFYGILAFVLTIVLVVVYYLVTKSKKTKHKKNKKKH